jgi:site-specific DNA recombinase
VTEPSEDSDGPMGALIEGIMESVADWYSQNLASETTKGKRERTMQGLHNNQPPFGMRKDENDMLVADEVELPGLKLAFEKYATGRYSDRDIAQLLNREGYWTKTNRPFSKETVRFMLQNRTYLGKIRYQQTTYTADGRRSRQAPIEWLEGQHLPVIDQEVFERCLEMRNKRQHHHQYTEKHVPYLLRNLVYCYRCCSNPPADKTFRTYGKMRPQTRIESRVTYYRCRAREMGYTCRQKGVNAHVIDDQVVKVLQQLRPPHNWRQGVTEAVGELLGEQKLEARLAEIYDIIRRMDTRWDLGFFASEEEYFEQRLKLQHEVERLTPVSDDELAQAAD